MEHRDTRPLRACGARRPTWQHEIRRINRLADAAPQNSRPQETGSGVWFVEYRSIFAQLPKIDP